MNGLLDIFSNKILLCGLTGWFVAQALKIPTYWLVERKWDWRRFFGSGGMPSSHSALMVSLTILIGVTYGFASGIFALSFAISTIVMYDAAGVRRETGNQAQVINDILQHLFLDGTPISNEELKELIGHTPLEVTAGAIIGVIVALFYM